MLTLPLQLVLHRDPAGRPFTYLHVCCRYIIRNERMQTHFFTVRFPNYGLTVGLGVMSHRSRRYPWNRMLE
jgi:hypothetical protein